MRRTTIIGLLSIILVQFAQAQTKEFQSVGYNGSYSFRDVSTKVQSVIIRSGWWIDAIQLVSSERNFPLRGGSGGRLNRFDLQPDERITVVSGTYGGQYGNYIVSLQFTTNKRTSPVYGAKRGTYKFQFIIPNKHEFAGFKGSYGKHLNSLGVLYQPTATTSRPPALYSPAVNARLDNGCSNQSNEQMQWNFSWEAVPGASQYHIYVKHDQSSAPIITQYTTSNRYNFTQYKNIPNHQLTGWKWYVRTNVNGTWSAWSTARNFSVERDNSDCGGSNISLAAPNLNAPYANATLDNSCTSGSDPMKWNFYWNRVNGASKYEIYVANRNSSRPLTNVTVSGNSYSYTGRGGGYIADHLTTGWYWKVRACSTNGTWGPWSTSRNFYVEKVNTDCKPIQIKMKNEGAYVAKFTVTYKVNGVSKKWSSPNVAVTWKKTLDLPSNAQSIFVSAKTVGIGEKQIFRVQALGSTCFKVYGTVFNPSMNGNGCD